MNKEWKNECLMLATANQGMSRGEIMKAIEPIGGIEDIKICRHVFDGTVYNYQAIFVKFASKDNMNKALHTDLTNIGLSFMEVDAFFSNPVIAFIFGLPRPENISLYTEFFSPFGARELRVIEKASFADDYLLVTSFESKAVYKRFHKIVNGSYVSGHRIHIVGFNPEEKPKYEPIMPSLSEVLSDPEDHDFSLLYYDNIYKCWSGAAIALSGTIREAAAKDPNINHFVVQQIPGPFELIAKYFNGQSIQMNNNNAVFLMFMAESLQISELKIATHRFIYETGDIDSIICLLQYLYDYNADISHHLAMVANQFEQIKDSIYVKRYPAELLEKIFASPYLTLKSEDDLLKYVFNFQKSDPPKFHYLIRQIRIERLSNKGLIRILSDPSVDLNTMRAGLLHMSQQINFGFSLQTDDNKPRNLKSIHGNPTTFGDLFRAQMFEIRDNNLFNGIFANLKQQCGRNPHNAGLVSVSASQVSRSDPAILIDASNTEWFGTNDTRNSWVMVDFLQMRISLTGYSLRTHSHEGNGHITGWKLIASNNNDEWTELHQVTHTNQFENLGASAYYRLEQSSNFYRYFKLVQTQPNTMGYHNLRLSNIELFGAVQRA